MMAIDGTCAADLADAYARSFRDASLSANGNTDCNSARLQLLNFFDAAVAAERERWRKADGYALVMHPDDSMVRHLPEGQLVILQRRVVPLSES